MEAEPESLLLVLCEAGIPVRRAWLPLENECMDPRGPAFTVELAHDDKRMGEFDFIRGNGRLECAPRLQHYPGC